MRMEIVFYLGPLLFFLPIWEEKGKENGMKNTITKLFSTFSSYFYIIRT